MSESATYHHGNLRAALIDVGLDHTRAGGPGALSLRSVTRTVGVSPSAVYRHFADRDDLLRAVVERIHAEVTEGMRARRAGIAPESGRERVRAVGLGYIDFALRETGWFETAFHTSDALPGGRGMPAPLAALVDALDAMAADGALTEDAREGAEWPYWSAMHGFALLALHGPARFFTPDALWEAAERTVDTAIAGLVAT
jgi:AcrR family transcriptional regulator